MDNSVKIVGERGFGGGGRYHRGIEGIKNGKNKIIIRKKLYGLVSSKCIQISYIQYIKYQKLVMANTMF